MTLEQFGDRFGVSHPAVLNWEKTGPESANMTWGIEKDLRLFILNALGANPEAFAEDYRNLARPARVTSRRVVVDVAA